VPEEMRLKMSAEDRHRWCRRDVLRQTVPDVKCSNWKSSVADGWYPRRVDGQRRWRGRT